MNETDRFAALRDVQREHERNLADHALLEQLGELAEHGALGALGWLTADEIATIASYVRAHGRPVAVRELAEQWTWDLDGKLKPGSLERLQEWLQLGADDTLPAGYAARAETAFQAQLRAWTGCARVLDGLTRSELIAFADAALARGLIDVARELVNTWLRGEDVYDDEREQLAPYTTLA